MSRRDIAAVILPCRQRGERVLHMGGATPVQAVLRLAEALRRPPTALRFLPEAGAAFAIAAEPDPTAPLALVDRGLSLAEAGRALGAIREGATA